MRENLKRLSFFLVELILSFTFLAKENILYSRKWDNLKYGNHRAVVLVDKKTNSAFVKIEWRRRDNEPQNKKLIIIEAKSGKEIKDFIVISINNIYGELIFKPLLSPSIYYIYFMPYRYKGSKNYPKTEYLFPKSEHKSSWIKKYSSFREEGIKQLYRAKFLRIESVNKFNSFTELEKIASKKEIKNLLLKNKNLPYLLFPENRKNIIRMFNKIPYSWAKEGPKSKIELKAKRGEYLTFQIGIYASKKNIKTIKFSSTDFKGKEDIIEADKITCFNIEGFNYKGEKITKNVSLKKGEVLPLYFGIDIPENIKPGKYKGYITIAPQNAKKQIIKVLININDKKINEQGDDNPYNLSRLRWLNSKIGADNKPVFPFTPLKIKGKTIKLLGRKVKLSNSGLPSGILTYFKDTLTEINNKGENILKHPVEFTVIKENNKSEKFRFNDLRFTKIKEGKIEWVNRGESKNFKITIKGSIEYDGFMGYKINLTSKSRVKIKDILLRVPFSYKFANYMMGLGYKGGKRPRRFFWRWDRRKNQDSIWIGSVNGGIQISVRDTNYIRPLNTNFYHLKPLNMPPSWWNRGKGGFRLKEISKTVVSEFYSGRRTIKKDKILHFYFNFLITPFKTTDTKTHFKRRYYHAFKPVEVIKKTGANIINVHHATKIKPYINYPFLRLKEMKNYIKEAHKNGMKVKIYYTVRELSNHAPEIFALKSFGDEVFAPGEGTGPSWLVEHFGKNFIAGWYVPMYEDSAIITNGTSRWHNYYVEGLNYLVRKADIDGLYIDDIAFDRIIMKRVKRVFEMNGKRAIIDVHSANQYNPRDGFASSANLYLEHFPFIDRLWFGEYFNYNSAPDYWLTEISGIPFGVMGEMLQGGGKSLQRNALWNDIKTSMGWQSKTSLETMG